MVTFIQRPARYYYLRLIRQEGSLDQISAGMALGVFVGLITPPGPQMIIAVIIASIAGWNKISSALGVWITNPFTIPFIYPLQVWLGSAIAGIPLSFEPPSSIPELWKLLTNGQHHSSLMAALLIGASVSAVVCSFLSFFVTKFIVHSYRTKKLARLQRIKKQQIARATNSASS